MLSRESVTGLELLLQQPPESLLHGDLQSLAIRVSEQSDPHRARWFSFAVLAVAQPGAVDTNVVCAFALVQARGFRTQRHAAVVIRDIEERIRIADQAQEYLGQQKGEADTEEDQQKLFS